MPSTRAPPPLRFSPVSHRVIEPGRHSAGVGRRDQATGRPVSPRPPLQCRCASPRRDQPSAASARAWQARRGLRASACGIAPAYRASTGRSMLSQRALVTSSGCGSSSARTATARSSTHDHGGFRAAVRRISAKRRRVELERCGRLRRREGSRTRLPPVAAWCPRRHRHGRRSLELAAFRARPQDTEICDHNRRAGARKAERGRTTPAEPDGGDSRAARRHTVRGGASR
jgi:hypothetical protein